MFTFVRNLRSYIYKGEGNKQVTNEITGQIFNSLNILVGENNSGKSRLLRNIFAIQPYIQGLLAYSDDAKHKISSRVHSITQLLNNAKIVIDYFENTAEKYSTYFQIENFTRQLEQYNKQDKISSIANIDNVLSLLNDMYSTINNRLNNNNTHLEAYKLSDQILPKVQETISYVDRERDKLFLGARYIPIIRGLKPLVETDNNKWDYKNVFRNRVFFEYFEQFGMENLKPMIFTGQDFYNLVKSKLLGTKKDREFVNKYEAYLSENFFENKEVSIFPNEEREIVLIKIGNDDERPIYDLGDGIQSIIILTFELFSNLGRNMIFFIEEPEIYLHPKYQRRLIETLKNPEFENNQYFITTHSNHFLDLTFDYSGINIFTLYPTSDEANKKFIIERVSSDDVKPYDVLGVRNSSLLLSNCTIWVEGITDRLYINKYLELMQIYKYGKVKYKEDIHYSFIEYSGNNITHWSFIDQSDEVIKYNALTKKIFVISDNDFPQTTHAKYKRQEKLKENLGDNFYLLPTREVENLLSLHILKKVVCKFEKKKDENNIFSPKVKYNEKYKKAKMGEFLDTNIIDKRRKYSSSSGTINEKLTFCRYAINSMQTYDDLSEDAKSLTEQTLNFIETNNKR